MHYREIQPHPVLARFVRCYWELRSDTVPAPEPVVPDGCPELVINRADPFQQVGPDGVHSQPRLLLAGPMTETLTLHATGVVDLVGIRLEPASIPPLLRGLAASELREQRLDVFDLCPRLAKGLVRVAHGAEPWPHVERVLMAHFDSSPQLNSVEYAVDRIRRSRGGLPMSELAKLVAESPRTLQRAFKREVGLTPKTLARIERLQAVLRALEESPAVDLGAIALDFGYYDQSHLNRDFRAFTGQRPGAFLQERHALNDLFVAGQVR